MRNLITSLLVLGFTIASLGQVSEIWTKNYTNDVRWQQVTSYGHYIAGGSQSLMALNPDTGAQLWSAPEYANVPMEAVTQMGGSPLLSINLGTTIALLDPFSGEKKFDSNKAGIVEIIDQYLLYNASGILISGRNQENKETIVMASLETGNVAWTIREDYGRVVAVNETGENEVLIVTLFYNYKVNTKTGTIIWKNDVSSKASAQINKLGAFGALVKDVATQQANQMEINAAFYKHPTADLFIVASEQEGAASSSGFTSTSSSGGPQYSTTYVAYTLSSGKEVWTNKIQVNGRLGTLYFADKGFISLPDNAGGTMLNMYDYKTGEGMWGKKGRGVRIKGGVYDYEKAGDGLLVVTKQGDKDFISFLDINQGLLTFDKPVKIDGRLTYSEKASQGLLYITTEEVNILDPATGSLLLKDQVTTNGTWAQTDDALFVYDVKDKVVKKLDKKSGNTSIFSPDIRFEGKESPAYLEIRESGILISSDQNMMLIDHSGKLVYTKYLEAPREPGIVRALRYAQSVRAAYIGAVAYSASAQLGAISQANADNPAVTSIADGLGQAYGELGNAASDFAKKSWQMASARFKATAEGDNYLMILTRTDKSNSLVQVNKDTGKVEGQIDLGNDRNPDYTMDGVLGYVFYKTGPKTIKGYKL